LLLVCGLGRPVLRLAQPIEYEFYAIGNAEFIVNPQQRFLHRILFEAQFTRGFALVQAFCMPA